MTFSITARCRRTGDLGAAVTTKFFAVGALCPAVRAGVGAVASQAVPNPALKAACLDRLANGAPPDEALRQALASDALAHRRQVGLIDAGGRAAAHTGAKCEDARGHIIETDGVIAGNTLVSDDVLRAVASSWRQTSEGDGWPSACWRRWTLARPPGATAVGANRRPCWSATPTRCWRSTFVSTITPIPWSSCVDC